jgi:hypothetical protein
MKFKIELLERAGWQVRVCGLRHSSGHFLAFKFQICGRPLLARQSPVGARWSRFPAYDGS